MPRLTRRDTVQLLLLLLVVPFQFWLSHEFQQPHPVLQAVIEFMDGCQNFLTLHSQNCWETIITLAEYITVLPPGLSGQGDKLADESPAKEVLEFRNLQNNMFASSTVPRYVRSPKIRFRIGDVVMHKYKQLRGVIVGWDYKAQAPPEYLKELYKTKEADQPNYLIAIDTRDRLNPQFTYTPDENLELLTNVRVIHPNIDEYFEFYDGSRYIPRPWLQAIYPKD